MDEDLEIKKGIDMKSIYHEIDRGKTVTEIAESLGISRKTLYRYHEKYQSGLREPEEKRSLTKGRGVKKVVDMDFVYGEITAGKYVCDVAKELGVSKQTIYRRHNEIQKSSKK